MKLVIIGNGFDLSHNLKTSYYDFKNYIFKYHKDIYEFLETLINKSKINNLWNDLENNLGNKNFYNFLCDECKDSECNLTKEECLKKNEQFLNNLNNKTKLFKKCLCEWIKNVNDNEINDVNTFLSVFKNLDDSMILSFNYTNLIENKYNHDCYHIHGCIENIDLSDEEDLNKIIFGFINRLVVTESFIGESNNKNPKSIVYSDKDVDNLCVTNTEIGMKSCVNELMNIPESNFNNMFYKNRKNIIEEDKTHFFNDLRKNASKIDEIIVYGHSLTDLDTPYLKEIIKILETANNKNAYNWKVSYYNNNKSELKKNLLKIFPKINIDESIFFKIT